MKLYFFGADYPPTGGGISTYTYEWIKELSKQSEIESHEKLMFNSKTSRVTFFSVTWPIFKTFWKSKNISIFHSFNLFPIGFWIVFFGKIFRKKTIVTFYGTDANDTSGSAMTNVLKRWTLKHANLAYTISEYTKRVTERRYGLKQDKIKVIYPIVPNLSDLHAEIDKQKYGIGPDTFVVLSVARLVKRKGIDYLIRAISEARDPDIKLFIIGSGPERESLEKLIYQFNLAKRVYMLGQVEDIVSWYRIANVAVLVSYARGSTGDFEGLGLALLEAQSFGVPVIGTNSGGIPEAFLPSGTGLLVQEERVVDIVQALKELKSDSKLRARFSQSTTSFLSERFGVANTTGRYIELCKTL